MKLIMLPESERPEDPADQYFFQKAITDQVARYGYWRVRRSYRSYIDEWMYVKTLL